MITLRTPSRAVPNAQETKENRGTATNGGGPTTRLRIGPDDSMGTQSAERILKERMFRERRVR